MIKGASQAHLGPIWYHSEPSRNLQTSPKPQTIFQPWTFLPFLTAALLQKPSPISDMRRRWLCYRLSYLSGVPQIKIEIRQTKVKCLVKKNYVPLLSMARMRPQSILYSYYLAKDLVPRWQVCLVSFPMLLKPGLVNASLTKN